MPTALPITPTTHLTIEAAAVGLPTDRATHFARMVADRLREGHAAGQTEPATLEALRGEQAALAQVLAGDGFIHQAALAYAREMGSLGSPITHAEAMREMASTLRNRAADCQKFVRLLQRAGFVQTCRTESATPASPLPPYQLSPTKIAETIRRMVQPGDAAGAEPAIHVAATARGHQITHQALANIYRPEAGSLRAPLVDALARALPHATGQQIETLARGWLKGRHDPAHSIADGTKPGGEIYEAAMREADRLQQQKLAHAPATQTQAPRSIEGSLSPTPEAMIDSL